MPAPQEFIDFVDKNAGSFVKRLAEAVAIPRYIYLPFPADLLTQASRILQRQWRARQTSRGHQDGALAQQPAEGIWS
jgi:hypothetical protein